MRCGFHLPILKAVTLILLVLLLLPAGGLAAASSEPPLALLVEVQDLGRGTSGTVVGVVIQVAPEDRDRVGERARVVLSLGKDNEVIDRHSSVVGMQPDGSVLLYQEWPPGSYELEASIAAIDGTAAGLWIGAIEVGQASEPFAAPEGATVDAVALEVTPALAGGVQFLPPPDLGGIGGVQLEVEVPEQTAKVEFFHDGRAIGTRNRPPWTVSVALGDVIKRTVIRAVARDARGRLLGEDALVLNTPTGQLAVEVLLGEPSADSGQRTVTVSVSGAHRLQQVNLSVDDTLVKRWLRCPCVTSLPAAQLERATLLVADAVDDRGIRGDRVLHLQGAGSFTGSVRVELVELPVTVLSPSGQPVTGLAMENFTIFEDSQEIAAEGFGTTAELPLSLAIAVDISGSMEESFATVRTVVSDFAASLLTEGDEVTLVTFSWEPKVLLSWTETTTELASMMERLTPEGGTSMLDAVVHALEQFRGRRGQQALVLLTDGSDTTSRVSRDIAIRYAHTMRIPIFTIGLGLGPLSFDPRRILHSLAEETGGEAFFPKKVEELPAVYQRIDELLRSQYLLWYSSPSERPAEQFREIKVELSSGKGTVRTIRGYYPGK